MVLLLVRLSLKKKTQTPSNKATEGQRKALFAIMGKEEPGAKYVDIDKQRSTKVTNAMIKQFKKSLTAIENNPDNSPEAVERLSKGIKKQLVRAQEKLVTLKNSK